MGTVNYNNNRAVMGRYYNPGQQVPLRRHPHAFSAMPCTTTVDRKHHDLSGAKGR
jgi:hypothetical protein